MISLDYFICLLVKNFIILTLLRFDIIYGTVTQVSEFACIGEEIAIECNLTVPDPNTNNFRSKIIEFIIGDSMLSVLGTEINTTNDLVGGIRLTRLTAFTNSDSSNSKRILGSIKLLSYSSSDAGLRLGCSSGYYISGNDGSLDIVSKTLQLKAAAPPSAPSMMPISSSNIDPNTCSATVSLNWMPPSSTDRTVDRYYLSLQNETALDNIAAPANSYSHNTTLLLDTDYAYSVSASSCAGNSTTTTSYLDPINRYSLLKAVPNLIYDNFSNLFSLKWGLSNDSTTLIILQYSLSYNYSHSQGNVSITFFNNNITFSNLSSVRTHIQSITPHNFTTAVKVETNITACLRITHQCGQPYSVNKDLCCSISSTSIPYFPTLLPTSISNTFTSISTFPISTPMFTYESTSKSTAQIPVHNISNTPNSTLLGSIVVPFPIYLTIGISVIASLILIILIILTVCIFMLCIWKIKGLKRDKKEGFELDQPHSGTLYAELKFGNPAGIQKRAAIPKTKYTEIDQIRTLDKSYSTTSGVHQETFIY